MEWNPRGNALVLIGGDSFQFCNIYFVFLIHILFLINKMEEEKTISTEEIKDFIFDTTNYELIAQGAEGVFF